MQLGPKFDYDKPDLDYTPNRIAAVAVLIRYIWTAVRVRLLLASLSRNSPDPQLQSQVWWFFAHHWYFDHLLVLLAFVDAAFAAIPRLRDLSSRWIRRWLYRLEKKAWEDGDAQILAHVQKQLRAHGDESAKLPLALTAYDLITDPVNRSLIYRNRGDVLLAGGRTEDAKREFKKALDEAAECGCKATVLKALVGLYVCGEPITISDIDSQLHGLSGVGYEEFVAQFKRVLHSPP
jgi:tetratricopeptide (TPR) repeat protein